MSYSIVGNNRTPDFFLAWYEVCIDEDEDEYADIEGETVDEEDIFGRRAIVPKKGLSKLLAKNEFSFSFHSSIFTDILLNIYIICITFSYFLLRFAFLIF